MIERIAGGARFVAAAAADVVRRAVEAADIVALLLLASVVLLVEETTLPVSGDVYEDEGNRLFFTTRLWYRIDAGRKTSIRLDHSKV
jgi:hypothetical protein